MADIQILIDEYGIIKEAEKILPTEFKLNFLTALAELEDRDCYKHQAFPKTKLHIVKGQKLSTAKIYRAYIDKISGWRIHLQCSTEQNNTIILKQIIPGQKHDDCLDIIKSQRHRYQ